MKRVAQICLVVSIGLAAASPVQAQAFCTGPGCAALPFSQDSLNSLFFQFQYQYTNQLFSDIARASTLANITGAPTGTVNLQKFTIGTGVGAGAVPVTNRTLTLTGVGVFQNVPTGGVYASPRIFAGINLGYLFGNEYDPFSGSGSSPSFLSPARFDVFVQGVEYSRRYYLDSHKSRAAAGFYNRGVDVRYHLVEGSPIVGGPLLRFLGVSIGTGYHISRVNLEVNQYAKYKVAAVNGAILYWDGYNYLRIQSKVKTYPVELMTGMQLLYFLNLSVGGGVTTNSGYANMDLTRIGPTYLGTDLTNNVLSGLGINQISSTFDNYLVLNIPGRGSIPKHVPYAKVGVDFNIYVVKIFAEGVYAKHAAGANVGARVQF